MNYKRLGAALLLLLAGFFAGFQTHRVWYTPKPGQADTVYVERTASADSLKPVDTALRPDLPPVAIPAKEVQVIHDTVYIRPETQTFHEQLAPGVMATAIITGVRPTLDHLQITWPETLVTNTIVKPYKGWMLSATSDFSALASVSPTFIARAALEASYNTGPIHLGLQGGVAATQYNGSWTPAPFIGARLTADIMKRR